jgi:hypothetical protein
MRKSTKANTSPSSLSEPTSGLLKPRALALVLGGLGVLVAIFGLFLIARGDITAAPILLVLAYLVLFPLALTRE